MTEGGYTRDEILKGERIILQVSKFDLTLSFFIDKSTLIESRIQHLTLLFSLQLG